MTDRFIGNQYTHRNVTGSHTPVCRTFCRSAVNAKRTRERSTAARRCGRSPRRRGTAHARASSGRRSAAATACSTANGRARDVLPRAARRWSLHCRMSSRHRRRPVGQFGSTRSDDVPTRIPRHGVEDGNDSPLRHRRTSNLVGKGIAISRAGSRLATPRSFTTRRPLPSQSRRLRRSRRFTNLPCLSNDHAFSGGAQAPSAATRG